MRWICGYSGVRIFVDWCTEKYLIYVHMHGLFFFLSIYTAHLYVKVINLFMNYDAVTEHNTSTFIYVGL